MQFNMENMFRFGIAVISIYLILSVAPSPVPDDTASCNIVTFPNQCSKADDDNDNANDYEYDSTPSNSNCSSTDCQSSSSSYTPPQYNNDMNSDNCGKSCDCSPCPYTCSSTLSTGICACKLHEEDNSCSVGQVSLFGYSVTDNSILLFFETDVDAKANNSTAIITSCINPTTGFWHNNTLQINQQDIGRQYQYNVTDLLPSTAYTCCTSLKYTKIGALTCLNVSTAVTAPSQIAYPIVYGIMVQRISATSVGIKLNTSSQFLSNDALSFTGCLVSYGINNLNECHQWSMPRVCSSVSINQTLILTDLSPNFEYCINITILHPNTDPSTFISYADIYENSPVRIVLSPSSGGGIDCPIWIYTETAQKLSDITSNLTHKINITEDYVLYKYFEACNPQNMGTEYIFFRCNIIGYNKGRNSTILAEEVRDRLEGVAMFVAGVKMIVSKVCLGLDCLSSTIDDEMSDGEDTAIPTTTSILSGVIVLLVILIIILVAIGIGIRLRKTVIRRKCRSKDSDQMVLNDADSSITDYATVLHRSPPPYPSLRNSAASMIEEVYDDTTGIVEETKTDLLYSQIADYVGFTARGSICNDESLRDIKTTSNPGYSINDTDLS